MQEPLTHQMNDAASLLRALPLEAFEAPKPNDAWERCALARASDAILVRAVADAIAIPKIQIESSFLLHAPLEILARAWLLQHMPPHKRQDARRRIAEIAVRYAGEGPEIASKPRDYPSVAHAMQELAAALQAGDADAVDSALLFLLPRVSAARFRAALGEEILPSLGAAGHAPILLMMLPGAVDCYPGLGALLRSPLRALALEAGQRLTWIESVATSIEQTTPDLFVRLAALPSRIEVPSFSIAATMLGVERDGYAASVLTSATSFMTVLEAERILLRAAALSMLQDDPVHAPYGWTHCLTLPQAILSLGDIASNATRVVRIAATHVLGFRATLGSACLQYPYVPVPQTGDGLLQRDPADAAAVAFNAVGDQRHSIRALLMEHAATHADCHLVKYTVACLTAADRDPQESALYLAAAAYLGAWWDRADHS